MKRLLVAALAAASLVLAALGHAYAATPRPDAYPLHGGSHGQRVADVQWLVGGHKPNVFTKVHPTFKFKPNGAYGARTKAAVKAYKYRVGYPAKGQCGAKTSAVTDTAGAYFVSVLEGHVQRPACWVAVAQQRVRVVEPGASKTALAIKALEVGELGTHEIPDGSNRGPHISYMPAGWAHEPYQSTTGAWGAAWCASFQQWAFATVGYGTFADRSAGVLYIEGWAQKHGYLNAKAKVGSLVAFLDDGGHIGYVVKVTASGYSTIEGNEGNAVREVFHPWNYRLRVFIDLPGVA